jgi:hypothetical protein
MTLHQLLGQRFPICGEHPPGGCWSPGGGAKVVCMRDIFIVNEILAQVKICTYILVGTLLGRNINLALFFKLNFTEVYIT